MASVSFAWVHTTGNERPRKATGIPSWRQSSVLPCVNRPCWRRPFKSRLYKSVARNQFALARAVGGKTHASVARRSMMVYAPHSASVVWWCTDLIVCCQHQQWLPNLWFLGWHLQGLSGMDEKQLPRWRGRTVTVCIILAPTSTSVYLRTFRQFLCV